MRSLRTRDGFTLVEMMVALVVFSGLIAIAVTLFTSQVRAFTAGADRAELTLTGEFASAMLSRELRTAGTNVVADQPWLVYGGSDVVAFHADLVSRVADPFAVYIDPDAPPEVVQTLRRQDRYALPGTAFTYPDSTYWAAPGLPAPAELVIFYFEPDTSTARDDDFILHRRVNDAAPDVIARGLLRTGTRPFLEFLELTGDSMPQLVPVPNAALPLRHSVALHLSAADTGAVARIDSVRAVRYTFSSTNGRSGAEERTLDHSGVVWLRNGGLANRRTCGSAPIFTSTVTVTGLIQNGSPAVRIQWTAALDETSGEEDVIRYVVWRTAPFAMLGDPLLSIPSGSGTYEYVDKNVQPGDAWVYAVAAQDCTPTMSPPVASGIVIVPTP